MPPHLSLNGLSKRYGAAVAAADVTLSIEKAGATALLGPSGCGKTTTLRIAAGLAQLDSGTVHVAGRDLTRAPAYKRNMGYVFQSYALFPHLDVAANAGFGLVERGIARAERETRVREALALVRLSGLEARKPRELSGGQQQRVALARALVIEPDVLLLDESLSNLDAKLRDAMRIEIRDLQRKLGITTLFVTHDQTEALTLCDRIAVMNAGRIEQEASPREIYDQPATRFVAEFVGRSSVIAAQRQGDALEAAGVNILAGRPLPDGAAFDIFLRPQRLRLAPLSEPAGSMNRLTGRIASQVFVGDRIEVIVETPAGRITAETSSSHGLPPEGAETAVLWTPEDTLVFPGRNA